MNILRNLAFCRKRNCKRKAYAATPFFHKPMSWQSNTVLLNIKNDGSYCKKEKKMQDDFMKSCLVILFIKKKKVHVLRHVLKPAFTKFQTRDQSRG